MYTRVVCGTTKREITPMHELNNDESAAARAAVRISSRRELSERSWRHAAGPDPCW